MCVVIVTNTKNFFPSASTHPPSGTNEMSSIYAGPLNRSIIHLISFLFGRVMRYEARSAKPGEITSSAVGRGNESHPSYPCRAKDPNRPRSPGVAYNYLGKEPVVLRNNLGRNGGDAGKLAPFTSLFACSGSFLRLRPTRHSGAIPSSTGVGRQFAALSTKPNTRARSLPRRGITNLVTGVIIR